jgi:hypothetical protein
MILISAAPAVSNWSAMVLPTNPAPPVMKKRLPAISFIFTPD